MPLSVLFGALIKKRVREREAAIVPSINRPLCCPLEKSFRLSLACKGLRKHACIIRIGTKIFARSRGCVQERERGSPRRILARVIFRPKRSANNARTRENSLSRGDDHVPKMDFLYYAGIYVRFYCWCENGISELWVADLLNKRSRWALKTRLFLSNNIYKKFVVGVV